MTNLKERIMADADDVANNNGRRRLWMMFSGIGIIMTSGAISGYLSQRNAEGDGALNMLDASILGLFAAVILLLATPYFKWARQHWFEQDPMARLDAAYPSLTKFEYEISVAAGPVVREALGYEP